jgi:FAD/FMN-containing dehydrogenase
MVDVTTLRNRVAGPVLTPDDDGFADEVASWVQTFTHTPEVAVGAATPEDVVQAVAFASANGLSVRVQGTGHGSHAAITDGLLVTTSRLNSVTVDADSRLATIGAGVQWAAVVASAAEHDLAPISGSSGTVGVVGFLTGGGFGPLVRSHGIASDRVRAFQVVTGDGELVHASADDHADLFWALRGGKGGLGIVTEVTIELIELATLYGGSLAYDAENIETALRAWIAFTETAPADVSTSAAVMRVPDLPFLPEPIRGRTLLSLRFAYPGDAATGEDLAAPLRSAAPVYLDQLSEIPAASIGTIHNDPPDPSVGWATGRMLSGADQDFASKLLEFAGAGKEFPFVVVEVRHFGSSVEQDVPGGSAVGGRSSKYSLNLVGVPNPQLFETVIPGAAAAFLGAVAPWISPESNVNFAPAFTSQEEFEAAWPTETFARLVEVRKKYDPKGLFVYGPR